MKVISFKEKLEDKLDTRDITLSTFNLELKDFDVKELYPYIDKRMKVRIVDEVSGEEEWGMRALNRHELGDELRKVAINYESERVAFIILDMNKDYVYIKELDKLAVAEKGVFEKDIKGFLYLYAIDYLMLLQRISEDVYLWISKES